MFCVFHRRDRPAGSPATHKGCVRESDPPLEPKSLCGVTFRFLFPEARKGLLTLGFVTCPSLDLHDKITLSILNNWYFGEHLWSLEVEEGGTEG